VAIVRELELLGRLLRRLYPEIEPARDRFVERGPMPPRHLVRQFVRLCSVLTPVLDRARSNAGERVVETQESVLKVAGHVPSLLLVPEFYEDPHLPDDLARYPAAVAATQFLVADENPPENLRLLRRWRSLFSPSGRSYRSLNLTLDAVKEGMPLRLLPELRRIKLRNPITDPIHLKVLLRTVHAVSRIRRRDVDPVLRILANAKLDELRDAFEQVAEHYNVAGLNHVSHLAERRFVRLLLSVEPTRRMRLRRLLDTAIQREREREMLEAIREVGGPERPTAEPPINLPDHPEVRFLATVADVLDESEGMHHCIHTYARGAVLGQYYLFHVTHDGQHATAQVDNDGDLVAVQGPRNSENEAVERAKELLRPWGEKLADAVGIRRHEELLEPADDRQVRLFDFFDPVEFEEVMEIEG
jgi:hypothetical protein